MNWKSFAGGAVVGIVLVTGTLAWAHEQRGDNRDHGMGMMGMRSQMQDMMNQCSDVMNRMMNERDAGAMHSDRHASDYRGTDAAER